ncbi:MAG: hypothetical protein QNJ90_10395 [Planctomycetota bacterium]|nr:hypothetical protein [Planctomycetota bacterium]
MDGAASSPKSGSRCVRGLALLLIGAALVIGAGCGGGGSGDLTDPVEEPFVAQFHVVDTAGFPVVGATIYLVPTGEIDTAPFNAVAVRTGASEDRDEPLEDAVRLRGASFPQAVTGTDGMATIGDIPDGRYFHFVLPSPGDSEHLPGGCGCRQAVDAVALYAQPTSITMSSQPSTTATYVGSTSCLTCHSEYATQSTHAHKLGFAVPGQFSPGQDASRYPEYEDGWNQFTPSASYLGGTVVWFSDFDPSRGADKFKTTLTDPTIADPGAVNYAKAYLWRDTADQRFKITLENVHPAAGVPGLGDPPNLWTLTVELTYGGALYKQRFLVSVPGRLGRYPLLQYQTEGDDSRFDRTRKVFRDYHLDWFWDDAQKVFKLPPATKTFEGNCTACHSTGFERTFEASTGEWLSNAVEDPQGAFDIDGNGRVDEINLGCEVCHGPGSEHRSWALSNLGSGNEARYIVTPEYLSPSRSMMICGRCHDRPAGAGSLINSEPLNAADQMLRVGASRTEFLANHTTRKGPADSNMWGDNVHSKSHHQQYTDLLKSPKHRNDRLLVVCSDCHDGHGYAPFTRHLDYDPDNSGPGGLCDRCHQVDLEPHMLALTGALHAGGSTRCGDCHSPKTAKTGAGNFGILLGVPNGTAGDESIVYWENDITSHLWATIPKKTNVSVAGEVPSKAMPVPFTNNCGAPCHDASPLQLPKPRFDLFSRKPAQNR